MVSLTTTRHATIRQQNRGLSDELLEFILDFGHVEYGSGAAWYSIRENTLPRYLRCSQLADAARPWIVAVSSDECSVVTVYARSDPARHIRQKCRKTHQWGKHLSETYSLLGTVL
jgi:hypothetical protein